MMHPLINRLTAAIVLAAAGTAVQADGLIRVEQTVFGMDCAPCAYGVQKSLTKLPGVTKVDVSLNDGKALIELGPDSVTTLTQIRDTLLHGGFTPKGAVITVVGRVVKAGDRLRLKVSDTEQYDLSFTQSGADAALKPDMEVVIEGAVADLAPDTIHSLAVQKVEPRPGA